MSANSKLSAAVALLSTLLLLLFIGCDDRNEADRPPQVYYLSGSYNAGGVMRHIDSDGDRVAIAALGGGAHILNVANPSAIVEVYSYEVPGTFPERVAIAAEPEIYAFFAGLTFGDPVWGDGPIWNYAFPDSAVGTLTFSGPLSDIAAIADMEATPATLTIVASDLTAGDGFSGTRYYLDAAAAAWRWDSGYSSPSYTAPHGDIRGFGISGDLVAMACNEDGVHIKNYVTNTELSDLLTPGLAYDCAWYGDYIVVADRYFVTIVNAADVGNPTLAASLTIPTADRLISVEVDGPYACVMDEFDGVYIVDLTNPSNPEMIQEIRLNEPSTVRTENKRLYIADEQEGLRIYSRP